MARNNTVIDGDLFLGSVPASDTPYNLVWNPSTELVTYQYLPYARPASATNVTYDVDVDGAWTNLATATGPNPTSAGQFTTNSSTPSLVSQIKINKTANASNNQSTQLTNLAVSSSITITQAGGGTGFGNYRIVTKTDNTSYMTYDVTNWGSSGGTFTNTQISTIASDGLGVYEYVLNSGYNLLNIQNNGDPVDRLRFKIPNNATTSDRVIVEAGLTVSSQNVIFSYQARSGSVSSTGQVNKDLYYIGNGINSSLVLSDTNDVAVIEFVCWGTGSSVNYGLTPSVAIQVYNN